MPNYRQKKPKKKTNNKNRNKNKNENNNNNNKNNNNTNNCLESDKQVLENKVNINKNLKTKACSERQSSEDEIQKGEITKPLHLNEENQRKLKENLCSFGFKPITTNSNSNSAIVTTLSETSPTNTQHYIATVSSTINTGLTISNNLVKNHHHYPNDDDDNTEEKGKSFKSLLPNEGTVPTESSSKKLQESLNVRKEIKPIVQNLINDIQNNNNNINPKSTNEFKENKEEELVLRNQVEKKNFEKINENLKGESIEYTDEDDYNDDDNDHDHDHDHNRDTTDEDISTDEDVLTEKEIDCEVKDIENLITQSECENIQVEPLVGMGANNTKDSSHAAKSSKSSSTTAIAADTTYYHNDDYDDTNAVCTLKSIHKFNDDDLQVNDEVNKTISKANEMTSLSSSLISLKEKPQGKVIVHRIIQENDQNELEKPQKQQEIPTDCQHFPSSSSSVSSSLALASSEKENEENNLENQERKVSKDHNIQSDINKLKDKRFEKNSDHPSTSQRNVKVIIHQIFVENEENPNPNPNQISSQNQKSSSEISANLGKTTNPGVYLTDILDDDDDDGDKNGKSFTKTRIFHNNNIDLSKEFKSPSSSLSPPFSPPFSPTLSDQQNVQIHELSDSCSGEFNSDNPPVVCEFESESEHSESLLSPEPEMEPNFSIEIIREDNHSINTIQQQEDLRLKRAQKRAALESHFLPQMLSPRYLDSILEETSDMSDGRSECSENQLSRSASNASTTSLDCNKVKKANAIFPKSQLDFSKPHKHGPLPKVIQKPIIREEPIALVLEAKLIEAQNEAEEICSRLSSVLTPESEAAEIVYIDSASSSISDLLELDLEQNLNENSNDHYNYDLDTDVNDIISKPLLEQNFNLTKDQREKTPVNELPSLSSSVGSQHLETKLNSLKEKEEEPLNFHPEIIQSNENLNENLKENLKENSNVTVGENAEHGKSEKKKLSSLDEEEFLKENLKEVNKQSYLNDFKNVPRDEEFLLKEKENIKVSNENEVKEENNDKNEEIEIEFENLLTKELSKNFLNEISCSGATQTTGQTDKNSLTLKFTELEQKPQTKSENFKTGIETESETEIETKIETETETLPKSSTDNHLYLLELEKEMDKVREILNQSEAFLNESNERNHLNQLNQSLNSENTQSPPPIPPPPLNFLTNYPPSDNSNTTDFTSTISSTNMNSNYLTEKENVSLNNLNENSNQNQNSNLNSKTLTRQASNDSYCSDSTNHSQCTAIHLDSLDTKDSDNPYNDFINLSDNLKQKWLDHRNDSFEQAQQLQLISDNNKNNNNNNNNDNLNNEEIKKLRLLCTEKLASLPYGEVVLEELAEVAKNIGELRALHDTNKMPYPLPDLPHINHLQVSLNKNDSKSLKEIKEAWLGLPTQNDPKVLLCLSPGQKAIIQESSDKKPDDLLDAHQKFIDRRGYYEFSEDEMKAMDLAHNDEKHIIETTAIMRKLRKSLTPTSSQTPSRSPTPPPIPPPPIPIKSSETIAKAQNMTSIHSNAKSFFMTNNTNNDSNNIETNKSHNDSDRQVTKENQELISNKQNSLADQSSVYETSHFNEITNNNKNRLLEIISDKNEIKPNTSSENIKVIETKPSSLEVESIAVVDAPPSTKEQIIEKSTKETSETAPLLSESESEKLKLDSSDLNKQFPTMLGMENELSKMFPSMGQHDIFDSKYKRFSNIESFTEPNYCQQLLSTQPKRHSHIETKSFESKKCIQNGKVLYDFETSSHDIENDGKKDLQNKDKLFFPYVNQKEESFSSKDFKPRETAFSTKSAETKESLESMESRKGAQASNNGKTFEIMSDLNINSEKQNIRNDNAFNDRSHTRKQQISDDLASKTSSTIGSFSSAEPSASASAKEKVHTLEIQVENDGKSNENRKENKNENKNENENINKNEYDFINKERQWSSQSHFHEKETKLQKGFGNTYEEFRQRAKDAIDSFSSPIFTDTSNSSKLFNETPNDKMNVKKSLGVDQEKLFKEFDDLHEKIEKELNKPKRSLYDQQRDKSSSLFDLDRLNLYQRSQIDEFKRQHSEHLEELEKEIERSFKSRQARLSMPRNLENLQNFNANAYVRDVPIHREENGKEFYQIPVKRIYNHNNPNENQNIIPNQNEKIYEIPIQKEMKSSDFASSTSETSHHFYEKDVKKTSSKEEKVYEIPIHRQAGEEKFKSSSGFQFPSSYDVPIQREIPVQREKAFFPSKEEEQANKVYQIPIQKEYEQAPAVPPLPIYQPETPSTARSYDIPIQVERGYESATDCVDNHSRQYRRAESMFDLSDTLPARPHTTSAYYPHIDDWSKYISDLGSSENIARPFAKEVEICHQRQRPNTIRAPRLSVSTNDLSYSTPTYDVHNAYNVRRTQAPMMMMNSNSQQKKPMYSSCYSMIERNPNPTYISTTGRRGVSPAPQNHYDRKPSSSSSILNEQDPKQRRGSLPKEIHEQQLKFIQSKEEELRSEFERLESERRRLLNAMEKVQQMPKQTRQALQTPQFRSQHRLPTLSEDEVFRQQMAEEWLNKVAEREERRLQKIIKISKAHESENVHSSRTSGSESTVHKSTKPDLSGEFLKKVQERRSKLHMPADSDWESGAESQPITQGNASESEDLSSVKILEGQSEADIKQMPRHLKEFARFSNHETEKIDGGHRDIHQEEERRQEANDNSQCSALKKTSIITTYKTSRQPIAPVRRSSNKTTTIPVIGNNNGLPVQDSSDMVAQQKQHQQKIHSRTDTAHVASVKKASAKHSHDQIIATANTGEKVLLRNTGVSKATGMPPKPKQTRFQLTSNRRSWSENDLLHEIDRELKLAKGFLFADVEQTTTAMFAPKFKAKAPSGSGIWTPKSSTPATSVSDLEKLSTAPTPPPPPSKPIWTPQPSPVPGRKEFRPVRFESPVLPRRYIISNNENNNSNSNVQPPWSYTNGNHIPNFQRSTNSCTNLSTPTTNVSESPTNYSESIVDAPNYLPSSASVSDKIKSFERSASTSELDRPFVRRRAYQDRKPAVYKPNEVIFNVKQEYMSEPETEYDRPKKMAQLGRRQYDGIGPVTNDGMPIILRSEVKEPHQHEWYKRLYQTIHKQKGGDDYVIRYKCQKGRIPYKAGGYQSEPEPNYDSDYSTYKYRTYNPRRLQSVSSVTNVRTGANYSSTDKLYGTMPNPVKSGQISYKNQPGRIENYVTGHSSVSEKEHKEWWDEVMDIFNGHLDQAKLSPHYTEGNLSRALARESGYTSDSNLVFRKKEVPLSSALSPVEQKQAYKSLQAGGEPPLFGFRKPAPEKPKGCVEEFEFIQITPTLTKIRVSFKEQEPEPEPESEAEPEQEEVQEEDCSKASLKSPKEEESPSKTSKDQVIQSPKVEEGERISTTMYAGIPKKMPSFLALAKKKEELSNELPQAPPLPPNRNSSCTKASTKITKRHEQCFQPPGGAAGASETSKSNPSSLKKTLSNKNEALSRSKSAGAVSNLLASLNKTACKNTFRANREPDNLTFTRAVRLRSISPLRRQSRLIQLRQTNRSPVAFGRSISKERSFAEEKKRLENILPANKTNFEASTNILRDPSLKSPQEVKEAVRSYATCTAYARSKSLPRCRSRNEPYYSLNTTMRHTMCFPQTRPIFPFIDYTKRVTEVAPCNRAKFAKSLERASASNKSKVRKTISSDSLARTNSTFSIDSIPAKVKASKEQSIPKATKASSTKISKPMGSPAKKPSPNLQQSKSETNLGKKLSIPSKTIPKSADKPTQTKPLSIKKSKSSHYFHPSNGPSSTSMIEEYSVDSVRDKTNFWNDFNKQQQCKSLPPASKYVSLKSMPSCSRSPTREQLSSLYTEDYYNYIPTPEPFEFEEGPCFDDLVWQYEKKASKVDRTPSQVTDIARPHSPQHHGSSLRRFSPTREVRIPFEQNQWLSDSKEYLPERNFDQADSSSRNFSPTREIRVPLNRNVRSPSRRRIDNIRTQHKGETSKVIRASSLSSADDRSKKGLYLCSELSHSATSLNFGDRHSPTCRYRNNSERFTDLNRFYSTLERVGQLERATSSTDFRPIRKDSELLDFEEWRKVRLHERAEKELHYLVSKLKQEQREKDLLFRSKDVEDVKWRQEFDFGLHAKEKSVEDIRGDFETKLFLKDHDHRLGSRPSMLKPSWRRNTVGDLAPSLEVKASYHDKQTKEQSDLPLSNQLVSTLSREQITKITQQLNEIYSGKKLTNGDLSVSEDYVMTVERNTKPSASSKALKVRCNSTLTKDDLIGSKMRKQEEVNSLPRPVKKIEKPKPTRSHSPVMVGREMLGAIAAKQAEAFISKPPKIPPYPNEIKRSPLVQRPGEPKSTTKQGKTPDSKEDSLKDKGSLNENISQKIQYFEERQFEEPPKTIYHAREDSSPDEGEVMRLIEENMRNRSKEGYHLHKELSTSLTDIKDIFGERQTNRVNFHMDSSPTRPPDESNDYPQAFYDEIHHHHELSPDGSIDFFEELYRSRSVSPQSQSSSFLQRVCTGEVQKMKEHFETINQKEQHRHSDHFFGVSSLRKVRSDSDLNLNSGSKDALNSNIQLINQNNQYNMDADLLTHKMFRSNSQRGRSRKRNVLSPIGFKNRLMPHIDIISKTAALHQNIRKTSPQRPPSPGRSNSSNSGAVERIKTHFECGLPNANQYISSSNPDFRDINSISPHLTADWIAHKYPDPKQNTACCHGKPILKRSNLRCRSISPPRPRKCAKHQEFSIINHPFRPYYDDIFANQNFDPKKHQPKARYVPVGAEDSGIKQKSSRSLNGNIELIKKSMAVTFQDTIDNAPPIPPQPPIKGYYNDMNGNWTESPNKYFESDVNIHFKTPVRHEYKQSISEEELGKRQSEQMQKLYHEERRRKYLQELQDMNARRHTDNFTPSQKSPIALNRYDDFSADLAPKSPSNQYLTKTIARALYNFQGQNARELSFKKGDIIYLRRQIDKNWYEGEFNAMFGLLPANYVEIISRDGIQTKPKKPSEGQARAKYNFQAQSGVELSLNKGELVTLTRRVDENWFEGKIANRKGIFPVSYVEVLTDIGAEDIAAKTTVITNYSTTNLRPTLDILRTNINNEFNTLTQNGNHPVNGILKETKNGYKTDLLHVDTHSEPLAYRALYKYRPQNSDELELLEGDIVHVLEKCDDGWFVGTSQRTGCFGTFPGNYVERV